MLLWGLTLFQGKNGDIRKITVAVLVIQAVANDILVRYTKPRIVRLDLHLTAINASETAANAALYRKTQPHEQLVLADDAAGVALRFELLTNDPSLTLEASLSNWDGLTFIALARSILLSTMMSASLKI